MQTGTCEAPVLDIAPFAEAAAHHPRWPDGPWGSEGSALSCPLCPLSHLRCRLCLPGPASASHLSALLLWVPLSAQAAPRSRSPCARAGGAQPLLWFAAHAAHTQTPLQVVTHHTALLPMAPACCPQYMNGKVKLEPSLHWLPRSTHSMQVPLLLLRADQPARWQV